MKKLRNSTKAIIITIAAIICAVGIVLGCLIGIKPKPNNPINPVDNKNKLTAEQIKLGEALNSKVEDQTLKAFDTTIFEDAGFEINDITKIFDYGFMTNVSASSNEYKYMLYIYQYDENGALVGSKSMAELLNLDIENISDITENNRTLQFYLTDNQSDYQAFVKINDRGGIENKFLLKFGILNDAMTVEIDGVNYYYLGSQQIDNFLYVACLDIVSQPQIYKIVRFDFNDSDTSIDKITVKDFELENNVDLSDYSTIENSIIFNSTDKSVLYGTKKEIYVDNYESGALVSTKLELIDGCFYSFESYADGYMIFEYTTSTEINYKFFDLNLNIIKNLVLDNDYKLEYFKKVNETNYFYAVLSKEIENNIENESEEETLNNKQYRMIYFDGFGNKVISYNAVNEYDTILYMYENKFLTKANIMTTDSNLEGRVLIKLEDGQGNAYTVPANINNGSFVCKSTQGYFVMNLNGNNIFESTYNDIITYSNGYYLAISSDKYYILNANNGSETLIKKFDKNNDNIYLLSLDFGMYFTKNDDNKTFTLHNFKGEIVTENGKPLNSVKSYKLSCDNSYSILTVNLESETKYFYSTKTFSMASQAQSITTTETNSAASYAAGSITSHTVTDSYIHFAPNGNALYAVADAYLEYYNESGIEGQSLLIKFNTGYFASAYDNDLFELNICTLTYSKFDALTFQIRPTYNNFIITNLKFQNKEYDKKQIGFTYYYENENQDNQKICFKIVPTSNRDDTNSLAYYSNYRQKYGPLYGYNKNGTIYGSTFYTGTDAKHTIQYDSQKIWYEIQYLTSLDYNDMKQVDDNSEEGDSNGKLYKDSKGPYIWSGGYYNSIYNNSKRITGYIDTRGKSGYDNFKNYVSIDTSYLLSSMTSLKGCYAASIVPGYVIQGEYLNKPDRFTDLTIYDEEGFLYVNKIYQKSYGIDYVINNYYNSLAFSIEDLNTNLLSHNNNGTQYFYVIYEPIVYEITLNTEDRNGHSGTNYAEYSVYKRDGLNKLFTDYACTKEVNYYNMLGYPYPYIDGHRFFGYKFDRSEDSDFVINYNYAYSSDLVSQINSDTTLYAYYESDFYLGFVMADSNRNLLVNDDGNLSYKSVSFGINNGAANDFKLIRTDGSVHYLTNYLTYEYVEVYMYKPELLTMYNILLLDSFKYKYGLEYDENDWKFDGLTNYNYESNSSIYVLFGSGASEYIFDGWAYYDKINNKYIKLSLKYPYTTLSQIMTANNIEDYSDDEKHIELFATFKVNDLDIRMAGSTGHGGGSVTNNSSDILINTDTITPKITWNVAYTNLKGETNKIINNEIKNCNINNSYASFFTYNNSQYFANAFNNITFEFESNYSDYNLGDIELYNFVFQTGENTYKVTKYDTSTSSSTSVPLTIRFNTTTNKWEIINSDYTNRTYKTYNNIVIDNSSNHHYIRFTIYNYALTTSQYGNNPGILQGDYGFKVVPYAETVFQNSDDVSVSGNYTNFDNYSVMSIGKSNNPSFRLNGKYYTTNWTSSGKVYYKPNDDSFVIINNGNPPSGSTLIGYYDKNNTGYLYYNLNNVNHNQTEVISLAPVQETVNASLTTSAAISFTNYYELTSYISKISINGSSITIPKIKLSNSDYRKYETTSTGTIISSFRNPNIYYADGNTYTINDAIQFDLAGRTFVLVIATNINNNYAMYFLYTDTSDNSTTINFEFSDIQSNVNIAATAYNNDVYEGSGTNDLINVVGVSSNSFNVKPTDLNTFRISPKTGYLINKITLKHGTETLLSLSRSSTNLQYIEAANEQYFSFVTGSVGNPTIHNSYTGTGNIMPGVNGKLNSNGENKFGIFYGTYNGNLWGNSVTNFESLYIMLGGIYQNVEINVEVISYAEFDFVNGNLLGLNNTTNSLGRLAIKNSSGSTITSGFTIQRFGTSNNYRVIFLGTAAQLKNGVQISAVGDDYAYYFSGLENYENGSASAAISTDNSIKGKNNDEYILLSTNGFAKYSNNLSYNSTTSNYIFAKKYVLGMTVTAYTYSATLNSYLQNNNKYQLDNIQKNNSWFNDIILTDITSTYQKLNVGSTTKSWRNDIANSNKTFASDVFGKKLTFVYNEIPGYYLKSIRINNNDINITSASMSGNLASDADIRYEIIYSNSKFTLSISQGSETSIAQIKDISVAFYSDPYDITINFNANTGHSTTAPSLSMPVDSITLKYDSLIKLESLPTMTGYTFVGWGSQNANGSLRYDSTTNTWNSSSKWTKVTSGNIFNGQNTNYADYDYYIPNGYFITDTGYSNRNDNLVNKYNFWSAYAETFFDKVGKRFDNNNSVSYNIDLYAIWKPNVYKISLNLNSSYSNNGSTPTWLNYKNGGFNEALTNDSVSNIYAFVTFDSNDWYINENASSLKSKQVPLFSNIQVDRYGYTFLNWTAKAETYEKEGIASSKSVTVVNKDTKLDNTLYKALFGNSLPTIETITIRYISQTNSPTDGTTITGTKFYKYASSGVKSDDCINIKVDDVEYLDTALGGGTNTNKYRCAITIYAYWSANKYKINAYYRDPNDANKLGLSGNMFGSTYVEDSSKTTFASYHFDDENFANIINNANPVRIGYDFVGWNYAGHDLNVFLTTANTNSYSSNNYLNNGLIFTGYNSAATSQNVLYNGTSLETLGDATGEQHNVNLYAVWRAQKFTINFALNIGVQDLINLYNIDSNFAVALLNSSNANGYVGINQNYIKYTNDVNDYAFNDIIANVLFSAEFDKSLTEAVFTFGNYKLTDLFATSAGYYFAGWLIDAIDANDPNHTLYNYVSTDSKVSFDKDGKLTANYLANISNKTLDLTLYNILVNSNLKVLSDNNFITDNKDFLHNIDAVNASTNFGYITIDGNNYYLAYESYTNANLFFIYNGAKYSANIGITGKTLQFNDSFFYIEEGGNRYIIRCDSDENFYYVDSNGIINYVEFTCNVDGLTNFTFTPKITRQFTLYADWELKNSEFSIKISNGNNGAGLPIASQTPDNNSGLAGNFDLYVNGKPTESTFDDPDNDSNIGYNSSGISVKNYNYYNDASVAIQPFYNGRYLSEMRLSYYAIEWSDGMYKNINYILTLKFAFDSEERIIKLSNVTVARLDGNKEPTTVGSFDKNDIENGLVYDKLSNARLSLLSREELNKFIFSVSEYATNPSSQTKNRRDINKVTFNLENMSSNIEITCKFSVQTFNFDIYNLFDSNDDNLTQRGNSNVYDTIYRNMDEFREAVAKSPSENYEVLDSSEEYDWIGTFSGNYRIATISDDCADKQITTFNVPYGYFVYGDKYTSTSYRPVDVVSNVNQKFNGYSYIYSSDIYSAGKTGISLKSVGDDRYYAQVAPLIGDPDVFGDLTFKLDLTTFVMKGWYRVQEDNGSIIMIAYGDDEDKYLNANVTLYGYYYSRNRETSIDFYTWNDGTYYDKLNTGNDYVLNNNEIKGSFKVENGLVVKIDNDNLVDNNNLAKIKLYSEYGVDREKFRDQVFTKDEFDKLTDNDFVNKLLRTYWYTANSYTCLYFENASKNKIYIKYDVVTDKFYYEDEAGIHFTDLISSNLEEFSIEIGNVRQPLTPEIKYDYNFNGSKLYVKQTVGDQDRYYQIFETSDSENQRYYSSVGAMPQIINSNPRYYVDINGERLYLMLRQGTHNNPASTLYKEDGTIYNSSYTIENIDEYYALINGNYYKAEFEIFTDANNSEFVSPFNPNYHNIITINNGSQTTLLYLDLSSNNPNLYIDAELTKKPDFKYEIYCSVNKNYLIGYETSSVEAGGNYIISGIILNAVPSPNSGPWYAGSRYGFVSYIKFTLADLGRLKVRDTDSDLIVNDRQTIYNAFRNLILNREDNNLTSLTDTELARVLDAVLTKISEYTLNDLLNSLIGVSSYIYDENHFATDVISSIPITFNNLSIVKDNGTILDPFSLTATVRYKFEVISVGKTVIDDTIYAIPIYYPLVMNFNNSASHSGYEVNIDTSLTNVSHFEKIGSDIHIYKQETDYLNFVVLDEEQYTLYAKASNKDNYLTTVISNTNSYVSDLGILNNGTSNNVKFNFTGKSGNYYIIMFYYRYDANKLPADRTQVTRVSDDTLKVSISDSLIIKVL